MLWQHFLHLLKPSELSMKAKDTAKVNLALKLKQPTLPSIKKTNTSRKLLEKPWLNSSLSTRNSKREELPKLELTRNLEKLKRKKRKVKLPSTLKKMPKLLSMPLKMLRRNLSTMKRRLIKKIRLTKLKMIKMINLRRSQRKKTIKN